MSSREPHTHFPRTAYPDRPYDRAVPYDWNIEGDFDRPPVDDSDVSDGMYRPGRAIQRVAVAGLVSAVAGLAWASTAVKPEEGPIRADDVPAGLPRAVKDQEDSAVKVRYAAYPGAWNTGSGVKVGPDTVLTAGHVVLGDNPDRQMECGDSYLLNRYSGDLGRPDQLLNRNAVFSQRNYGPDMAILSVQKSEAFRALPTARIAGEEPETGDTVFFINYEQSGRDPDISRYPEGVQGFSDMSAGYDHPAEYAGIVLGRWGGFMAVATGGRGYGPPGPGRERNTYPGASGGPVFNSGGELVGMSVAVDSGYRTPALERYYGVDLPPGPRALQVTFVQVVNEENVQTFTDRLPEKPLC